MTRNTNIIVVVIIALLVTTSCEDKIVPTPLEYTQVFTGPTKKTWKLSSLAFKNVGDPDWTLTNSCWSDERYTFYRDAERKYEYVSGSNKCDASEVPQTISDTWSFSNANASLYFIFPLLADVALPFIVKSVDTKSMTLEIYFNDAGSQSYQMKFNVVSEN